MTTELGYVGLSCDQRFGMRIDSIARWVGATSRQLNGGYGMHFSVMVFGDNVKRHDQIGEAFQSGRVPPSRLPATRASRTARYSIRVSASLCTPPRAWRQPQGGPSP